MSNELINNLNSISDSDLKIWEDIYKEGQKTTSQILAKIRKEIKRRKKLIKLEVIK